MPRASPLSLAARLHVCPATTRPYAKEEAGLSPTPGSASLPWYLLPGTSRACLPAPCPPAISPTTPRSPCGAALCRVFLDTLPLLLPRLWAPAHPPPQVLRVGQLITQASAHSSPFLKTSAPFPASVAPAANWNHLYLPPSRHWELALSSSSSLSHTAPPRPPYPASPGSRWRHMCWGEREISWEAGRMEVENRCGAHSYCPPGADGWAAAGKEGAQPLVPTALGDTPSQMQASAARTGGGCPEEQPRQQAGQLPQRALGPGPA